MKTGHAESGGGGMNRQALAAGACSGIGRPFARAMARQRARAK